MVGGALAKLVLRKLGISVEAYTSQVGTIALENDYKHYNLALSEQNAVRCPDPQKAHEMETLIKEVKAAGDTIGGVITCVVKGCPPGLGEPEFDKLHALLGHAMLSINAVKGFEIGEGFGSAAMRGSEMNDVFIAAATGGAGTQENRVSTLTNHSGGVQGGISNGQDICMRIAFKPVATLLCEQQTVDADGHAITFTAQGRHDPCVLPRAVPIVEAMAAMVILDTFLQDNALKI